MLEISELLCKAEYSTYANMEKTHRKSKFFRFSQKNSKKVPSPDNSELSGINVVVHYNHKSEIENNNNINNNSNNIDNNNNNYVEAENNKFVVHYNHKNEVEKNYLSQNNNGDQFYTSTENSAKNQN